VLVDASTLDDAGVFALDTRTTLVQTVDFFTPIVDDPEDYGRIAAANALSDVYAMGGKPITALALMGFPDDRLSSEVLAAILAGGAAAMREAECVILGGHTIRDPELKFGYAVTGVVDRRRMLTNAGARPGDRLLLTKPLGTGVLATALKRERLPAALERRLTRSMATLNRAASEIAVASGVRAATDITGFGLVGHAAQMAEASGVTFRIAPAADWLLPRVEAFIREGAVPAGLGRNREFYAPSVEASGVDVARLDALYDPQTSGGLLLAVPAAKAEALVRGLRRHRVPAIEIGVVTRRGRRSVEVVATT
jgi:selenide,water dikinase